MLKDRNPTVRRYPRTMQEAFPQDYSEWFEVHKPEPRWYSVLSALLAVAFLLFWVGNEYF